MLLRWPPTGRACEGSSVVAHLPDEVAGPLLRRSPTRFIVRFRLDQNMGCVEQVRRTEPFPVGVIKASAFLFARFGRFDLAFEQQPDERVVLGFASSRFVTLWFRFQAEAARFLQQQFPNGEGPGRLGPCGFGIRSRMVLDFLSDGLGADLDAVDPHLAKRGRRRDGRLRAPAPASFTGAGHGWRSALCRIAEVEDVEAPAHVAVPSSNATEILRTGMKER